MNALDYLGKTLNFRSWVSKVLKTVVFHQDIDKYLMFDFLLQTFAQIIIAILVVKAFQAFKKTKEDQKPKSTQQDWEATETMLAKMETRLESLRKREIEIKERLWFLEDENTILRFKVVEYQKITAGERPEETAHRFDDDEE